MTAGRFLPAPRPMSSEEIRERLREMDREDAEITELLEELIDTCEFCSRRRKAGAAAGCLSCIAADVMKT